jgi:hypothetical protein
MRTGVRIAIIVVVVQLIAAPVFIMLAMGSASTTANGSRVEDDSGANLAAAAIVIGVSLALMIGLSFVPARFVAVGAAAIGCIGQFVAMSDLSELDVDTEIGVQALFLGYIAVAVAAIAARRSGPPSTHPPHMAQGYPPGSYGYGPGPG